MHTDAIARPFDWTGAAPAAQTAGKRMTLQQVVRSWLGSASSRDAYLAEATDHADLAARMRRWDEKERRDAEWFCQCIG